MSTKMKGRMDPAVSPVIGVLLMLVVTIIIAAVVSGFAGGLVGSEKTAPSAAIEVKADSSSDQVNIKHLSGDLLNTADLEIITYYKNDAGTEYKAVTNKNTATTLIYGANPDYGTADNYSRIPFLNDMSKTGGLYQYSAWFGNFTFSNGDIMTTQNVNGTAGFLGFPYSDSNNFKSGEFFDMKIKHVPSGKLIYDKEVAIA